MANLIDITFFVGEINIPNTSKPEIAESLELFIAKYEPEFIRKLFGNEMYASYLNAPTDPRFTEIINGKDNWRGLVYPISDSVDGSPIANYIYTMWLKDKHVWNSGVGTVRSKGDGTEVMPISFKMTEMWNQMSRQIVEFQTFMSDKSEIYPDYSPYDIWEFRRINEFDI